LIPRHHSLPEMIGIFPDFWPVTGVKKENWKKSTVLQHPCGHCNAGNLISRAEKIIVPWEEK
jgi:hypothetical protein